jgi:hypothetical protein
MLAELQATGFIGMWKDREDIGDSTEFVQRLREQIQARAVTRAGRGASYR